MTLSFHNASEVDVGFYSLLPAYLPTWNLAEGDTGWSPAKLIYVSVYLFTTSDI